MYNRTTRKFQEKRPHNGPRRSEKDEITPVS